MLYTWWQENASGAARSKEVVLDLSLCKASKHMYVQGPCVRKVRLHYSLRLIFQRRNPEDEDALRVEDREDRSAMEPAVFG